VLISDILNICTVWISNIKTICWLLAPTWDQITPFTNTLQSWLCFACFHSAHCLQELLCQAVEMSLFSYLEETEVFMIVALRNNLWSGRLDLSCFLYRIHYLHIAVSLYFSIIKHLNGIINNFIVFQIYCLLGSRRYVTQRIKNIIYLFKIYRI